MNSQFCLWASSLLLVGSGVAFSAEKAKLAAPNAGSFDRFGQAVAISEDYLIVAAHQEDTGASSAGSVYVYSKADQTHLRTLNASDAGANHFFGSSLAAEGNQVLIGAPGNGSGAAYLFNLDTGAELKKFLPNNPSPGDQFGYSVALSSTHVLVGAWLEDNDDNVPSEDSGAAYLFDRQSFSLLHRLQASDIENADQFGGSVALTSTRACVGSLFDNHSGQADAGSVYIYDISSGSELDKIMSPAPAEGDVFGAAIAANNNLLVVGAPEADAQGASSGSALLFDLSTGSLLASLTPEGAAAQQRLGNSVAIGEKIVVGAFRTAVGSFNDAGVAHTFSLSGTYENTLVASDAFTADFLGFSVATSEALALVGAIQDDDGGPSSGSAYLFSTNTPNLLEDLTITANGSSITLNWQATPNVTYSIYTTTDLANWSATPSFTTTPTTSNATFTDPTATWARKKFYRIVVD